MRKFLTFDTFSRRNLLRCEDAFHSIERWTPDQWMTAITGELGEAANFLKKMNRVKDGTNTAKDPQTEAECIENIGAELADTFTYIDLLATRLEIDLEQELVKKFNEVSKRMNSPINLEECKR